MENAAEALKMAGGVLIFVLALSICINAFTNTRQGIDNIVLYSDREFLTTYVEQNKGTKRIVGAESIVPTIYRAYKENIKIKFDFLNNDADDCLYYKVTTAGTEYINYIDLERENIADETMKEYILKRILFGDGEHGRNIEDDKEKQISWTFNSNGLYNRLTAGNTYEESLGVYFKGEENGRSDDFKGNKTEKKVITYRLADPS